MLRQVISHVILISGTCFLLMPVALIFFSSTHETQLLAADGLQLNLGSSFTKNYGSVLALKAGFTEQITALAMFKNSLIVGFGVATLTTLLSLMSAFSIVFFKLPVANFLFWAIFSTLLFPIEARIIPTFEVATFLGLINTHLGIILPTLATALGTFFFRQFFLGLPEELCEAAKMDGAGSLRFFVDFIVPLSLNRAGVVFMISFMIGWNQYLWPLMISTDDSLFTLVRGIRLIGQESGVGMAFVIISIVPPLILLWIFQRWVFEKMSDAHIDVLR